MNTWKLGTVPYLNVKPLVAQLEGRAGVELIDAVPSRLAGMLERREVDAALVSSIIPISDPSLCALRAGAVTSDGPVRSIRLMSKTPAREIRRLALDASSRTSVALCQALLGRLYGLHPEIVSMPPNIPAMLEAADAALVIGDPALLAWAAVQRGELPQVCEDIDLGEVWRSVMGLPFVYAAWAAPKDGPVDALAALLREAAEWGETRKIEIADAEAPKLGLPAEMCRDYLTQSIRHRFGPREWEGMAAFQRLCMEEGLLPPGLPPFEVAG
ncbi:MAG TPA: menaquinone biosynthesis protein [Armatimonadota bacterium]|jgi:predicted solute-binding protein